MLTKHCLQEFKLDCQLRRLSDRTIKGYYNNTLNFLVYAEKHHEILEVDEIRAVHIKHYMQYLLKKKLSASYINGILKCLRAFFAFAVQEEYVCANPATKVKMQKEPKVLIETFSDDEVRSLMSAFDYSTFLSARNKMILAIAFDTGARNTEICDIKRDDIRDNVILIHGKGNKERHVPISPYLRKVMLKYERMRDYYFDDKHVQYTVIDYVANRSYSAKPMIGSFIASPHRLALENGTYILYLSLDRNELIQTIEAVMPPDTKGLWDSMIKNMQNLYQEMEVSHLSEIQILDAPSIYAKNPKLDTKQESEEALDEMFGSKRAITLWFSNDILDRAVLDLGKDVILQPVGKEGFETTIRRRADNTFFKWVDSLGGKAKILAPADVVEQYSIDWDNTYSEADKYLKVVGLTESSHTLVKDIGVGKQQMVEIAKALAKHARLLILDEPTSSLNETDSQALLDLMLQFKSEGMSCIIITHKLNEVSYVADEITVIRDGSTIETMDNAGHDIDEDRIIQGMVGREIEDRFPKRPGVQVGDVNMEVKDWTVYHPLYEGKKVVDNVSIQVRKGEVVGISGLMGAGRTELAMSLFGRTYGANISGKLTLGGKEVTLRNAREAIKNGLAYVTEDRKGNGLILGSPIRVNTTLANLDALISRGALDHDKEYAVAEEYRKKLRTKCYGIEQKVGNLSGGNQQKVLLAKWMFTDPDILILDEPTRGIDVGAKYEIYCIINDLVAQGKSVVMISSELPEVLGMSDRIYVMNEGKIVGEFMQKDASQESIMACILKSTNN